MNTYRTPAWRNLAVLLLAVFTGFVAAGSGPGLSFVANVGAFGGAYNCQLVTNADGSFDQHCDPAVSPTPSPTPTATATPTPTPTATSTPSPSPTSTPTPTPTTTSPTPTTGCIPNPHLCGFPDATNTGASGTLTVVNGNVTLGTAGLVYQDKDVRGCILVTAPNVTIKNVKVTGCTGGYFIDWFGSSGVLTVDHVTIDCGSNWGATGIGEINLVSKAVNVTNCTNGWDLDANSTVQDSYCYNLADEVIHPTAHTDCVQGIMTNNITIRHNTLLSSLPYSTSAVGGGVAGPNWVVDNNLLDGGAYPVYCHDGGAGVGSKVTNNRFGHSGWNAIQNNAPPSTGCNQANVLWSNNVYDATGVAVSAH